MSHPCVLSQWFCVLEQVCFHVVNMFAHLNRIFSKPHNSLLPQLSLPKSARLEWYAFAGCFSQAQWQAI